MKVDTILYATGLIAWSECQAALLRAAAAQRVDPCPDWLATAP